MPLTLRPLSCAWERSRRRERRGMPSNEQARWRSCAHVYPTPLERLFHFVRDLPMVQARQGET